MNALRNVAVAPAAPETDYVERAGELGVKFAARAAEHDSGDVFVAANYADLKAAKIFSAGVPGELGGGGASHAELCAMLRTLARHCPSTALALAMHTHQVATPAWRWRNDRALACANTASSTYRSSASRSTMAATGASPSPSQPRSRTLRCR